jgi:hypothetical protein
VSVRQRTVIAVRYWPAKAVDASVRWKEFITHLDVDSSSADGHLAWRYARARLFTNAVPFQRQHESTHTMNTITSSEGHAFIKGRRPGDDHAEAVTVAVVTSY